MFTHKKHTVMTSEGYRLESITHGIYRIIDGKGSTLPCRYAEKNIESFPYLIDPETSHVLTWLGQLTDSCVYY